MSIFSLPDRLAYENDEGGVDEGRLSMVLLLLQFMSVTSFSGSGWDKEMSPFFLTGQSADISFLYPFSNWI